jgi:hypothetical protein
MRGGNQAGIKDSTGVEEVQMACTKKSEIEEAIALNNSGVEEAQRAVRGRMKWEFNHAAIKITSGVKRAQRTCEEDNEL